MEIKVGRFTLSGEPGGAVHVEGDDVFAEERGAYGTRTTCRADELPKLVEALQAFVLPAHRDAYPGADAFAAFKCRDCTAQFGTVDELARHERKSDHGHARYSESLGG